MSTIQHANKKQGGLVLPPQAKRQSGQSKTRGSSAHNRPQQTSQKYSNANKIIKDLMGITQADHSSDRKDNHPAVSQQQVMHQMLSQLTNPPPAQKRGTSVQKQQKNVPGGSHSLPRQSQQSVGKKTNSTAQPKASTNNQQLKGIMAAALASVKDNQSSNAYNEGAAALKVN